MSDHIASMEITMAEGKRCLGVVDIESSLEFSPASVLLGRFHGNHVGGGDDEFLLSHAC